MPRLLVLVVPRPAQAVVREVLADPRPCGGAVDSHRPSGAVIPHRTVDRQPPAVVGASRCGDRCTRNATPPGTVPEPCSSSATDVALSQQGDLAPERPVVPDVRQVDAGRRPAVVHQGAQGAGELGVTARVGTGHLDGDEQVVGEAPLSPRQDLRASPLGNTGRLMALIRRPCPIGSLGRALACMDTAEFWEDFYAGRTRWSGRPNELLVAEVEAEITPGDALDLGCGEGGDAIWLAQRGWQVTAVDVSANALAAATAQARRAASTGHRWERHDLDETFPDGTFDLVVSCYLQSPVALGRTAILRAAAAAVRPVACSS